MTSVRGHKRSKPSGGTTQVRQYRRRGFRVSPRHSLKLLVKAFRAARKRKRVTAAVFGGLALVELVSWLTLTGVAVILATAAVLAGATAYVAAQGAGMPSRPGGRGPAMRGGGDQ